MSEETKTLGGNPSYSLSRTTVSEDTKKVDRDDFIQHLMHNLDDYDMVQVSPQEVERVQKHIRKLSTGSAAMVPLLCGGERCPFKTKCPLFAIGKHQEGLQCLLEVQLMKEWIMRYFDEYKVDPQNFTEVAYINELAEIEIHLMRLNMSLAKPENADLMIDQMIGIGRDGETPIIQKNISPYMELKDKLQNRRSRVIKLMVGHRQEKYKKEAALKIKEEKDPSSRQAMMRQKLESLQRDLENKQKELSGDNSPRKTFSPQDIIDSNNPVPTKERYGNGR